MIQSWGTSQLCENQNAKTHSGTFHDQMTDTLTPHFSFIFQMPCPRQGKVRFQNILSSTLTASSSELLAWTPLAVHTFPWVAG